MPEPDVAERIADRIRGRYSSGVCNREEVVAIVREELAEIIQHMRNGFGHQSISHVFSDKFLNINMKVSTFRAIKKFLALEARCG